MSRRVAFLIANEAFTPASGLENLLGPQNDVAAMGSVLEDPARGGFEVRSFLNETRAVVLPALDEALNQADGSDTVLLFYAGHGKLDNAGRLCLATADTRSTAMYSTSIPAAELRNLIGQSNCGEVVLLLDCCYSGAFGREFSRGSVADQLALTSQAQGLHVLTASTSYETARELEAGEGVVMGKFTRAIADGIQTGSADHDKDGLISLSDLRWHLQETVRGQTPQYWAQDAAGDPVIARVVGAQTPEQKRFRRLTAWYAEDRVPDAIYVAITNALAGNEDADLAIRAQRLLDNADVTAEALIGAWEGLVHRKDQRRKAEAQARLQAEADAQHKAEAARLNAEADIRHRAEEYAPHAQANAPRTDAEARQQREPVATVRTPAADAAPVAELSKPLEPDAPASKTARTDPVADEDTMPDVSRGLAWVLAAGAVAAAFIAAGVAAIVLQPAPAPSPQPQVASLPASPPEPQVASPPAPQPKQPGASPPAPQPEKQAASPPAPAPASPPDKAPEQSLAPPPAQGLGPTPQTPPQPEVAVPDPPLAPSHPPASVVPVRPACTFVAFRPGPDVLPPTEFAKNFLNPSASAHDFAPGRPDLCAPVDAIAPFVAFLPGGNLRLDIPSRATVGTTITAKLSAPQGSGANLSLDMFNERGEVYHLFGPTPAVNARAQWQVTRPTGKWLAVLLASPGSLWQGHSRTLQESAAAFLPLVTQALQVNTNSVVVAAAIIDVVLASTPPSKPARTSPLSKCELIKEKYLMEDSISDDERAVLRTCK